MPYARVPQILFWSAPLYLLSAQVHSFHEDPKCWLNHDQYFLCTSASKSPSLSIYLNIMRKIFPLLQAVNHDCFLYERPKISCYIYTRYTQQMCLMPLCSNVLNSREYTVSIEQMYKDMLSWCCQIFCACRQYFVLCWRFSKCKK